MTDLNSLNKEELITLVQQLQEQLDEVKTETEKTQTQKTATEDKPDNLEALPMAPLAPNPALAPLPATPMPQAAAGPAIVPGGALPHTIATAPLVGTDEPDEDQHSTVVFGLSDPLLLESATQVKRLVNKIQLPDTYALPSGIKFKKALKVSAKHMQETVATLRLIIQVAEAYAQGFNLPIPLGEAVSSVAHAHLKQLLQRYAELVLENQFDQTMVSNFRAMRAANMSAHDVAVFQACASIHTPTTATRPESWQSTPRSSSARRGRFAPRGRTRGQAADLSGGNRK